MWTGLSDSIEKEDKPRTGLSDSIEKEGKPRTLLAMRGHN